MIDKDVINEMKELQPFHTEDLIKDLYSWQEFEQLINLRPFVNSKRFHIITDKIFNWQSSFWASDKFSYPIDVVVEETQNNMAYLSDCSRVSKKINAVCEWLEYRLKMPTDAHIYFSLNKENKSFSKHKDEAHNLIVQIEGQNRFKIYNLEDKLIIDKVLNKNDAVFIPKGYAHQAESLSKRLSISFPMKPGDSKQEEFESRKWIEFKE